MKQQSQERWNHECKSWRSPTRFAADIQQCLFSQAMKAQKHCLKSSMMSLLPWSSIVRVALFSAKNYGPRILWSIWISCHCSIWKHPGRVGCTFLHQIRWASLPQPENSGRNTCHLRRTPHSVPRASGRTIFFSSQQTCGSLHGMLIQSPVHRSWWCGHTPSLPHSNAFAAAHRLVSLHTLQSMSFLWSVLKCSHWTGTHP